MKDRYPPADSWVFAKPEGSDVDMFIQWKGTEVCLDLRCLCGADGHLDADSAHFVRCPDCGTVYQMGTQVVARRVEAAEAYVEPRVLTVGDD